MTLCLRPKVNDLQIWIWWNDTENFSKFRDPNGIKYYEEIAKCDIGSVLLLLLFFFWKSLINLRLIRDECNDGVSLLFEINRSILTLIRFHNIEMKFQEFKTIISEIEWRISLWSIWCLFNHSFNKSWLIWDSIPWLWNFILNIDRWFQSLYFYSLSVSFFFVSLWVHFNQPNNNVQHS